MNAEYKPHSLLGFQSSTGELLGTSFARKDAIEQRNPERLAGAVAFPCFQCSANCSKTPETAVSHIHFRRLDMPHPVELAASRMVADLRLNPQLRRDSNVLTLTEGAYFSWDETNGEVALDVTPELGAIMHLKAWVSKVPNWFSFNFEMGDAAFTAGDVLGIALEYEGFAGETLKPFLRTARDGVLEDTVLQDWLEGSAARETRVLLHQIRAVDPAAGAPGYHTLVLPLPLRDFTMELRDMRLFVIPAARVGQLVQPTLGAA
ncbi:hypothetical protein PGB28_14210 [Primorskyibacter aestuariivivens]|uniref:hypothetical protein n=1 Tax=Primorskyibacter aestuariivivens TaxID=1888912 RepID=UPI002301DD0B|nr:hypothetical protein [Primorskyibacter aestuariivivens]MDA7429620.1 hypothetical protein [Primorskyibacter aestuariivivens]